MFQSTPRFVGEGNLDYIADGSRPKKFQSTPRFVGEGNRRPSPRSVETIAFQSTPRFVGEGNLTVRATVRPAQRFNPPPALSVSGILVRFGTRTLRGFKPCCHGSRSAAPEACSLAVLREVVSNLVVMEVGQRPAALATFTTMCQCFKPCCHGSRSAVRSPMKAFTRSSLSFKPCCHGSRSAAAFARGATRPIERFQTLLSWKSVSGLPRRR